MFLCRVEVRSAKCVEVTGGFEDDDVLVFACLGKKLVLLGAL